MEAGMKKAKSKAPPSKTEGRAPVARLIVRATRPVEIEAGDVEFAAGVGEAVARGCAGRCCVAERLESVRSLRCAGGIGQRERAVECIGTEIGRAHV